MAELQFKYGAMNSGKSTALINRAYSLREKGLPFLVTKPSIDTKGDSQIVSRAGLSVEVDFLTTPEMNLRKHIYELGGLALKTNQLRCLLVDEAQFLQPDQVDQLLEISKLDDIPVITYGLRTDFLRRTFPGSRRLIELADTFENIPAICDCGENAEFNTRMTNGVYVFEGDQVAIDGTGDTTYNSLCGKCYLEAMQASRG